MKNDERIDAEHFDAEFRAIEESLRDYLAEQLRLLDLGPAPTAPAAERPEGWFRRWRPEIYLVLVLIALTLLWWRLETRLAAPPAEVVPVSSSTARETPAVSGDPAAGTGKVEPATQEGASEDAEPTFEPAPEPVEP